MKRKSIHLLMGLMLALAFVSGVSAQEANPRFAFILKTLANPFWVTMKEGIQAEAKKQNVTVDIFAVQSEDDTQGQLQQFENLLNKGYDGIAFAPISPVNLIQPAAQAYKKGIKLVNVDEKVDMAALKSAGANIFAFVTTDNKAVGAKAANFIVQQVGPKGGEVAIIEGRAGAASGEDRKSGAASVFTSTPGFKLVASQPADWDRIKALDVATNIIQRFPNLKAIYCANDTMALGAMQAVINSGKSILVVGTDGDPEAVDMVKAGKLAATVAQDPAAVGAEGLRQLIAAVKSGKQIPLNDEPLFIAVDSKLITK
ncbi:MAG: D-allose-binding periplasmic protein precursor [Spirochaetes bacterium ADurb.Bin110]|nr:MAG: D-allose-binding periplasmic protein precursor [Spirochaetes bacterium ADurb.Bin110]